LNGTTFSAKHKTLEKERNNGTSNADTQKLCCILAPEGGINNGTSTPTHKAMLHICARAGLAFIHICSQKHMDSDCLLYFYRINQGKYL